MTYDYYESNNNYELRVMYKRIERKWSTGSTHVHYQFCVVMCSVIIFISYNSYHQCCKLIVSRNICNWSMREGVLCGMQNFEKVYSAEFHLRKIFAE